MKSDYLQQQSALALFISNRVSPESSKGYKCLAANKHEILSDIIELKKSWEASDNLCHSIYDECNEIELLASLTQSEIVGLQNSLDRMVNDTAEKLLSNVQLMSHKQKFNKEFGRFAPDFIIRDKFDNKIRPIDIDFLSEVKNSADEFASGFKWGESQIISATVEEVLIDILSQDNKDLDFGRALLKEDNANYIVSLFIRSTSNIELKRVISRLYRKVNEYEVELKSIMNNIEVLNKGGTWGVQFDRLHDISERNTKESLMNLIGRTQKGSDQSCLIS